MVEVSLLILAAVVMFKAYCGTKRPVLCAVINMLLGISALMTVGLLTGQIAVNYVTAAASLILGVPAVAGFYLVRVLILK